MIRYFAAPLPHFVETFIDNGYYDMWKIMKAPRDVNLRRHRDSGPQSGHGGGNFTQTVYGFA